MRRGKKYFKILEKQGPTPHPPKKPSCSEKRKKSGRDGIGDGGGGGWLSVRADSTHEPYIGRFSDNR